MAEYIERDKAIAVIEERARLRNHAHDMISYKYLKLAKWDIGDIPPADVRPVVRATWQSWEQDKPPCKWYSCDYCGFHALSKSNFCPNCGAMMEER